MKRGRESENRSHGDVSARQLSFITAAKPHYDLRRSDEVEKKKDGKVGD